MSQWHSEDEDRFVLLGLSSCKSPGPFRCPAARLRRHGRPDWHLDDPRSTGKALTGPTLGSYWRYRVGDCRLVRDIQDGAPCILVVEVGNRREIYRCIVSGQPLTKG